MVKITIEDEQSRLEKALAPILQPILAKGYRHRVALHGKDRKVRKDASADNWSPEFGEIRIQFEPDTRGAASKLNSKPTTAPTEDRGEQRPEGKPPLPSDALCELVRALDRAESKPGYGFVALKWFRDAFLLSEG